MESAITTTRHTSFATDPSAATVQADICLALVSIAADRRDQPKAKYEHLIKIISLQIQETQTTDIGDKKRLQSQRLKEIQSLHNDIQFGDLHV